MEQGEIKSGDADRASRFQILFAEGKPSECIAKGSSKECEVEIDDTCESVVLFKSDNLQLVAGKGCFYPKKNKSGKKNTSGERIKTNVSIKVLHKVCVTGNFAENSMIIPSIVCLQ